MIDPERQSADAKANWNINDLMNTSPITNERRPNHVESRMNGTPRWAQAPAMPGLGSRTFLLADGSESEVSLIQRAFTQAGIPHPLHVVPNGDEAVDYLRGAGPYSNRLEHPMPNVVLLNRDLPRKDGFGVLGWIRNQSALRSMVVVILTGSNRSADADTAYNLGANFYLTKPGQFEELVNLTRCLDDWLKRDGETVVNA
jgi:CheY-like chemotaxis protein